VRRRRLPLLAAAAVAVLVVSTAAPVAAEPPRGVRFATFNASLNRFTEGGLVADLATPGNAQARVVAETIQRARPDVLLVNEFDYDDGDVALDAFHDRYLAVGQNGADPITYPHRMAFASNTGIPSGFDLNNDGTAVTTPGSRGYGDDALGFGEFPGQYAFAVYSRYPIDTDGVRTFQDFLWRDMPGALLPDDPSTPAPADFFSPAELDVVRLSSKNHVDIPIEVGRRPVHLLASHPTPPTFDGPEDRNGRRNADEIRFWADYVRPGRRSRYIVDDAGVRGGLRAGGRFVIAGDLNADPVDGDSVPGAIQQVLEHPWVRDPRPTSAGAVEAAAVQGGANAAHRGDPAFDTADFNDSPAPGNLRADYVLPGRGLRATGIGGLLAAIVGPAVAPHRLLPLPGLRPPAGPRRRPPLNVERRTRPPRTPTLRRPPSPGRRTRPVHGGSRRCATPPRPSRRPAPGPACARAASARSRPGRGRRP